jgi:aspartyl-tRNA(Asn)/glutamyl-tRNA(Gln) amidotransferase subunit B
MASAHKNDYEPVIGLEVHAQLLTKSKIFCGCATTFGAPPNSQTCAVCLGMPGVLPVANREVISFALRAALATNCTINPRSVWARKNYFYPDLPKGYQITQFDQPLAEHGKLVIDLPAGEKSIGITRIHVEEDAGKNQHVEGADRSLVDFNRCGVPLIEVVSEPDLRSPEEAGAYLKALRAVLMAIGVCDGNMEEGSFRCDANLSLRRRGAEKFGAKVELKNMNSFRFIRQALQYEIERQAKLLDAGERVVQETRLFDSAKGITVGMRSKEEAHDYRYFPEPDLPPVFVDDDWIKSERVRLPELPRERQMRFCSTYGLSNYDAGVLVSDLEKAELFERWVGMAVPPKEVANWIINNIPDEELASYLKNPDVPASLIKLVGEGFISGTAAKENFVNLVGAVNARATVSGGLTITDLLKQVIIEGDLRQVSDTGILEVAIEKVMAANPAEVEKYRSGKKNLIGFFVGHVMKETKGKGDPKLVNELLKKKLE